MKSIMLALFALAAVSVQDDVKVPDHQFTKTEDLKWNDAPPSLPPGAKAVILEGNPAKPGPFTLRLKLPANYKVPPHFHGAVEHVTVLSGTLLFGVGDTFDEAKTTALAPGGFAVMQTGVKHFVATKEEVVIQAHAVGPWSLTYANPADDPRTKK